ncbi:tetratricopeptide repeat protein [Polaribacter sp. Asnod1-A03]|uniref:tetratricopeptide repeat protein n=1 Tax=Polaribacter sp. Asnod1-A03 TaxID=3160581 RepID=UPI00386976C5
MENNEFEAHLKKVITAEERKQQKDFLKSVEATIRIDKTKKTKWFIAASIAVIISLSSYFVFNNQSISNQELYATYFTPHRNIVVPIVRSETKATNKITAFKNYETGKYTEAIALFNQLTKNDSIDNNTLHFYKGNAYLQLNKPEKAILSFLKISDSDTNWQEERLWYLALASLKTDKKEDAKKYLIHLKSNNSKGFKLKEIENLLKEIN